MKKILEEIENEIPLECSYEEDARYHWPKRWNELKKRLKADQHETHCYMQNYDSKPDTQKHILRVRKLLRICQHELELRAKVHDESKLLSPEKELFDEYTPKLAGCTYGSDEYKEYLKGLKVALDHHYAKNSHHPEHYENGVNGFDLFDLIEMFMDWKAATERHDDGDIRKSIEINKNRFNLSEQVCDILRNTADRLGW